MLKSYLDFTTERIDADVRTGFNTYGFDNAYLCARINKLLGKGKKPLTEDDKKFGKGWFDYGRIRGITSDAKLMSSASSAHGKHESFVVPALGRIQFDLHKH